MAEFEASGNAVMKNHYIETGNLFCRAPVA
jgi:hypothetical protein